MYAALLVYVDAEGAPTDRVRLSAALADRFNATLIGLSAMAMKPPFVAEGVVIEEVTEADIGNMEAALAEKEKWFRGLAGNRHRKPEWRGVLDFPADALARNARAADLAVIGRSKGPGDAYTALDPRRAVLTIGRPALVVPDGVSELRAEHVVIGWKDTRESRRAVQDALPFLRLAARVTIVHVRMAGEEATVRSGTEDVAAYLTRHRIRGGPRVILQQEGSEAAQLIRLAQDERADLLVVGAYGHSRLGEWIFGGMTHELLATSPICCLMSH